jgi:2-(1,2-epoxy-1,2-dihydrophenyl)acetyl-CoA isomerase
MADDTEPLLVEREGAVLTMTLNRPRRKNALTGEMVIRIGDEIVNAGVDDETRVVVLRANGDDFCTGMDLAAPNRSSNNDAGSETGRPQRPRIGHLQRSFQVAPHRAIAAMEQAQVPIVAVVRGWAAGFGNALALSADFVVASPTAKFWVPFVTKGFTPDSGNTWILPRLVGLARAKEMVLRGQPIDGETAAAWGLISRCVPDDELDDSANELVSELAEAATSSIGFAKLLLHRNLDVSLASALQLEGVTEEVAVRSDDFKEGMKAFAEKRPPRYTGR